MVDRLSLFPSDVFLAGRRALRALFALFLGMAAVPGCSGGEEGITPPRLPEGAYFRFGIVGDSSGAEDFIAVTTDAAVIAAARDLLRLVPEDRNRHIDGSIAATNGGFNLGWSWHFTPDRWALVEVSKEVCDGGPSFVEMALEEWLRLGQFCPWGSYIKDEILPPAS